MKKILILVSPSKGDVDATDQHYLSDTALSEIEAACTRACDQHGFVPSFCQDDKADEILELIAKETVEFDALIMGPMGDLSEETAPRFELCRAAITALANRGAPIVEVHMDNAFRTAKSNIPQLREPDVKIGLICGLGVGGYSLAIESVALRQGAAR